MMQWSFRGAWGNYTFFPPTATTLRSAVQHLLRAVERADADTARAMGLVHYA